MLQTGLNCAYYNMHVYRVFQLVDIASVEQVIRTNYCEHKVLVLNTHQTVNIYQYSVIIALDDEKLSNRFLQRHLVC